MNINEHLSVSKAVFQVDRLGPIPIDVEVDLYYVTGDRGLPHLVDWLKTQKAVGLDLETSGLSARKDRIATLQIGTPLGKDPRAYVIDVRTVSKRALQPVLDVIGGREVVKLGQNIKFECNFIQAQLGCRVRNVADTQVTELVLRAGLLGKKSEGDPKGGDRTAYKHSSMAALCTRYLGISIDKDFDLRTGFYATPGGKHNTRQLEYAAGDVIYPFYIAEKQKTEIANRALKNVLKVEFEVIPVLADAELTGILLDVDQWEVLYNEAFEKRREAEHALDNLIRPCTLQKDLFDGKAETLARPIYPKTNKPINWDSAVQVKWAIEAYCKWKGWKLEIVSDYRRLWQLKREFGMDWLNKKLERNIWLRDNGREDECRDWSEKDIPDSVIPERQYCLLLDTDKDTLKLRMIRQQLPQDIVKLLLEQGKNAIRCDTFGMKFVDKHVDPVDGRVHTEWHQAATNTGRTSSSPNLQNQPNDPRYRKAWIPGKGKKFVIADYSQIEPRLSAQVSKDPVYTAAFLAHEDLYMNVAEVMFGHKPDLATDDGKRERQVAKVIVLGLAYRMGPWKLRDTLTLALADAIMFGQVEAPTIEYVTQLYNRFFEECYGIREYQDLCSTLADPKKTDRALIWDDFAQDAVTWIEAPCGRKRFFLPDAKGIFTEAPNAPIQGCSATITKAAAGLFQREVDKRGWQERCHIINLVHDELVVEVDEEIAEEAAKMLKAAMEKAGRFYLPDIPVIAEFPKNTNGVVDYWTKEIKEAV